MANEEMTRDEIVMDAAERIRALEEERDGYEEHLADALETIHKLKNEIQAYKEMPDESRHEDAVGITTKHRIRNIEIYFEED